MPASSDDTSIQNSPKPKKSQGMNKEALIYHFCQVGLSEHRVHHSAANLSTFEWKNKANHLQNC